MFTWNSWTELLALRFYDNTVAQWLQFVSITLVAAVLLRFGRNLLAARLHAWAQRTDTRLDDLVAGWVSKTKLLVLWIVALYVGASALELPEGAQGVATTVLWAGLLLQVAIWGNSFVGYLVRYYVSLEKEDGGAPATVSALTFIGRLLLWTLLVLVGLQNLGVEITALVASLGVGGIAVALASQNILSDLFASLSILLDEPFVVGDFIVVDDFPGTVEKIGLKTTRIRSLHGEQVVFSNNDLLGSRVRNYKRMKERRILFRFGVTYQTPAEKLRRIPETVREVVESARQTRLDRAHFHAFGDSSLDFEVV